MSFLADYLYYASQNEAPKMYHVWGAYYCLSAAISRRVWMFIDEKAVYCNIYVIYVGGAGGAKSSALDKALKVITALNLPISGDKETPEGMLRFMGGDSTNAKPIAPYGGAGYQQMLVTPRGIRDECHPMNVVASEFIDFIKVDEMGWINFLNNVYDREEYKYRTKNMGTDVIRGPYITLIGGVPTQTASNLQRDQVINSGLARRTYFQFGDRLWDKPHARPKQSDSQKAAMERCVEHLRKFSSISGEFHWDEETTGKWYDIWYAKNLRSVPTKMPSLRGWYASKGTQLMKLAMLTSLSYRTDMVLTVEHFQEALAYLEELEEGLYSVFGGVGKSDMGDVALKIYQNIVMQETIKKVPMDFNTIKIQNWPNLPHKRDPSKEVQECLDFLVGDGKLKSAVWSLGGISKTVYATPETFAHYVASSGIDFVPAPVAQSESDSDESAVADPSSEPGLTPPDPLSQAPSSSQLIPEALTDQPQIPN